MNHIHRGFIVPLLVVIIALFILGGGYVYTQKSNGNQAQPETQATSALTYAFTSPNESSFLKKGETFNVQFSPLHLSGAEAAELWIGPATASSTAVLVASTEAGTLNTALGTYALTVTDELWKYLRPTYDGQPLASKLSMKIGSQEKTGPGVRESIYSSSFESRPFYVLGESHVPSDVPQYPGGTRDSNGNNVWIRGHDYTLSWTPADTTLRPADEFPTSAVPVLTRIGAVASTSPVVLKQSITYDNLRIPNTTISIPADIAPGRYVVDFVDNGTCSQSLQPTGSVVATCPTHTYLNMQVTIE